MIMDFKKNHEYVSKADCAQEQAVIKGEMQGMATPIAGDPDVVTPAVMSAIADSKEMDTWFKGL